ncbi:Gfo/Idh/MocA family oxidoreductase [Ktedonosporobacter rubrisoli]|uniref:Gfo/Idh/MocA family oxidoreductase n=1 Tax=Ktedonosporobacter rubrisoli TaxID=2509675 RepID=A0A4P6JYF7_KTERU|nr:Gfo/Idh/MocA family oxidoreductase [Ktedonosporobacter rubrisoli]QBD80565.1 Gfo/Idh/MocA family oxidoreductase [Ktedonosporobacter rubrisoli]
MKPVDLLIVGAGSRGNIYASYATEHPDLARVVGVAEPREFFRTQMAEKHGCAASNVVEDWRELIARPRLADAVVIATPDALHLEPALAFANKGYDILLEKPLAPDVESCRRIVEAAVANKVIFAVGHVLRYTPYTQQLKKVLESGIIGDIVSVQHLEPVGYWHYAHSFVRGNWRNEALSSSMLLQKSCHDLDWLRYIIGRPCMQVSSFGSLMHFRKEAKPAAAGTALRCLDCAYEPNCPYSARRLYMQRLQEKDLGWPLDVITTDFTEAGVIAALQNGPYGRCVYESDNDVVDHQVVNLQYDNGITASFTMIATSQIRDRETDIFGTLGELRGDGKKIVHYDYLSEKTEEIAVPRPDTIGSHGGGDYGLMQQFVAAVAHRDPGRILSGPRESLETHLTVFAAEQARHEQRVVQIDVNNAI